jgi:putative phosphoesterase
MKKIAILSDIHGNIAALEKVVEDFKDRNVDRIFNLGDHLSGPLWPKETIEFLMRQDWVHIKGNHDRQLTSQAPETHGLSDRYAYPFLDNAEIGWLRSLPAAVTIEDHFLLVHGTPASDTTYFLETIFNGRTRLASPVEILERLGDPPSPVVLCGHTHVPRVVETINHTLIINPGSVGLPAYEDDTPEHHVVENGSPHARYAVLEFKNGRWVPELISVAYDHLLAADQAQKNGRTDWEVALRTGFMQG